MERRIFKVKDNIKQSEDYFILHLVCDKLPRIIPGQFVNVEIKDKYLRRPISVCDVNDNELVLAIKKNGVGTNKLSQLKKNDELDILLPLGNGVDLDNFDDEILLVGGGIGCAPLLYILKKAKERGLKVTTVLGFKDTNSTLLIDEFKSISDRCYVAYDDQNENVITKIKEHNLSDMKFFACGPNVMSRELAKVCKDGYFSLESRMGCGFGACMGCSTNFVSGMKRICKDGPVFKKDELLWENLV